MFLSEAQILECDLSLVSPYFDGHFSIHLNSEENVGEELAMDSNKVHGRTVIMISNNLAPHTHVLPSSSSAYTIVLVQVPHFDKSVHIALYMPTADKDSEFFFISSFKLR